MPTSQALRTVAESPVPLRHAREAAAAGWRISDDRGYVRVRPAVYAPAEPWHRLAPWERYLARVHAFALVSPHAVFCLESAGALLGLPVFGEPRDIHVFDTARHASRRFGDVVVHTGTRPRAVVVAAVNTTSLLDTTRDLARVLPPAFALAVADAAARAQPAIVTAATLGDAAALDSPRGQRQLRWVAARMDARAESVGESVSRAVIEWSGFPPPVLQQVFHYEGFEDRSDFYWPHTRSIGESDGWGKYGTDPEAVKAALFGEKRREDRLRRHGHGFGRWDHRDAMRVEPLARAVIQAGVPLTHPKNAAMLRTLGQNPRSL